MMTEDVRIREEVREILNGLLPHDATEIADDADIFDMGMDSVSTLLLVTQIENRYAIVVAANAVPYDQLRTIAGIASFITAALSDAQKSTGT